MKIRQYRACAIVLAGMLSSCAPAQEEVWLTQWGTPCAEYGLAPKACHAKFANYREYMASFRGPVRAIK